MLLNNNISFKKLVLRSNLLYKAVRILHRSALFKLCSAEQLCSVSLLKQFFLTGGLWPTGGLQKSFKWDVYFLLSHFNLKGAN